MSPLSRLSLTLLAGALLFALPHSRSAAQDTQPEDAVEIDPAAAEKAAKKVVTDSRLLTAVEAEGLKYSVASNGNLEVLIDYSEESRSQQVYLQSKTFRYIDNEFRDVYSIAFRFDAEAGLEPALARRLLEASNTFTMGFWATQEGTLYCIVRLPARATPSQVRDAIMFVAAEADELEKELLGSDEF